MNNQLIDRVKRSDRFVANLDPQEACEWEGTYLGVRAMEEKITLLGLDHVELNFAPKDWANQLVGILGCGYRGVSEAGVREALQDEGWTTTTFGALLPTGGAVLPIGPSENTD